ncbi:sn-glycerol-1-phosphate dehydrogenase [Actinomycetaceae bacterium UMB8039B]|uniref:sn-glycerol-1-phosphate dehydrogenase n=1 Tax=Pauljensenia sp. UMB8040A TaxID=3046343 RepID=UPI00254E1C9F|nr:sn-glycerol-1-phosphate dehydrogenase [Pauljensenia sp. UMB8040A]MDK7781404.1 sn-glycerol-1-phosphate dehydrogenase [Actinomycetaceae bacterium UMB8041B]MDK8294238.1 sn-glycerol-1-phosphate dehydrogenase [Actinomycetaceae bacterium UMB8039B]MDK8608366.1 sn-glycerol-1-phosphate dehydrogenase [Actinomycetaceae bacterium UMB8041A]MDK8753584.1 sn-glycerol-1-phosphate dehydrogenase [Actinomycetaceae bacterium UMB8039A]MDK6831203.1 sn-glycerol-1-phosphate dehydrogenase [Pauljensenia sp. UMB8040A]
MSQELIEQALKTATETKDIVFGTDVLDKTGELFARMFPGARVLVVADGNTFAAAGEPVVASLKAAGIEFAEEPYVFPGTPTLYAGYENVEKLREHIRPLENTVVCSIASGTLNDIAKLASGELGREYMNVCTAPSVDGYAAFGASISKDGFKITRSCPAPTALVADLRVIAAAPHRLIATGYGDLIEKIPAGADWILADELGIEPIDDYVWSLVQGPLRGALADPERIGAGDAEAITGLAEGNIMSGLAMQAAQSSRPASGAGHQFSHVWEMEGHGLDWEPPLSHGMKVGVGTVASCAIWEEALKIDMDALDVDAIVAAAKTDKEIEAKVRGLLIPRIADEAVKHSIEKNLQGNELRARIAAIREAWPRIVARVKDQLITADEVVDRLKKVGAPYHPEMIGIDMARFRETHIKAQTIRNRYTVLDLLTDLGMLDEVVERLFSEDGYWGRHAHKEA